MGQLIGIAVAILVLALIIRFIFIGAWKTAPQSFRHPASYVLAGGLGCVLYAAGSANGGPIYLEVGLPYFIVGMTVAIGTTLATLSYDEPTSSGEQSQADAGAAGAGVTAEALATHPFGSDLVKRVRTALLVHGYASTEDATSLSQALASFQRARGLPISQKIDPATLSALGIAL